jgi:hypothetical protein
MFKAGAPSPEERDIEASRTGKVSAALEFGHAWDYAPAPEATDHARVDPKYG